MDLEEKEKGEGGEKVAKKSSKCFDFNIQVIASHILEKLLRKV